MAVSYLLQAGLAHVANISGPDSMSKKSSSRSIRRKSMIYVERSRDGQSSLNMIALGRDLDSGSTSGYKKKKKKTKPKETNEDGEPLPGMWDSQSPEFSMSRKELQEIHKSQTPEGFFNPMGAKFSPKLSFFCSDKHAQLRRGKSGDSILTPRPVKATPKSQVPYVIHSSHSDLDTPKAKIMNPKRAPSSPAQSFSA